MSNPKTVKPGDRIRAYDHDRAAVEGLYVEGVVIKHTKYPSGMSYGVLVLEIACDVDTVFPEGDNRVGESVLVPVETFGDHRWSHDRVEIIS